MKKFHPLHMTNMSPWPLIASFITLNIVMSTTVMCHLKLNYILSMTIILTILIMYSWWRDISREAMIQGDHNWVAPMKNMKMGMILFITSEILFFSSFFWAYFHNSVIPSIEIGQIWPPLLISSFNPLNIPLLNTMVLLSSGISITWSHHLLMKNKFFMSKLTLLITVLLGFYFTLLQAFEYIEAEFSISDSIYGSTFFIATGFHGLHVIIGSLFLLINWFRMKKMNLANNHIIGFEVAAWYWHFVDVIWLFLYSAIYWWGK